MPNFMEQWLRDSFNDATPTSEIKPIELNGWKGIRRSFKGIKEPRDWLAIIGQKGKVFVLITADDEPDKMVARINISCLNVLYIPFFVVTPTSSPIIALLRMSS
jgi:hypothetical protein